jgi:hypothetical protein
MTGITIFRATQVDKGDEDLSGQGIEVYVPTSLHASTTNLTTLDLPLSAENFV